MLFRNFFGQLAFLISALLVSLIFIMDAFSADSKYGLLYLEAKSYYDKSEYVKCIDECDKIISEQENSFLQSKNYMFLAALYELKADCFDRKGDKRNARDCIQSLLTKLESFLPGDEVARLKLKIGHIYKYQRRYSKALSIYEKVEQEYKKIFPNRFAKYAREYVDDILSKQVAVISGKISLEGSVEVSGVVIEVFNGFEQSETNPLQNGCYTLPLYSSTPGTKFSLFAYRWGYMPVIINLPFSGDSNIVVKDIRLRPILTDDVGVVAGVVFTVISGGKRRSHHGITKFTSCKIMVQELSEARNGKETMSSEEVSLSSSDSGIYSSFLLPGSYLIGRDSFTLRKGEVRIINIACGEILVD
ncbi:MAG: hypothetical protein KAV87_35355 [Desulfobacteraceae bacterium]|nr:hypothetical protein [Desulfobacteraceae bacterium]